MAKKNRAYKSAKRSKELMRQRKQEEKRQRRVGKDRPEAEGSSNGSNTTTESGG